MFKVYLNTPFTFPRKSLLHDREKKPMKNPLVVNMGLDVVLVISFTLLRRTESTTKLPVPHIHRNSFVEPIP